MEDDKWAKEEWTRKSSKKAKEESQKRNAGK